MVILSYSKLAFIVHNISLSENKNAPSCGSHTIQDFSKDYPSLRNTQLADKFQHTKRFNCDYRSITRGSEQKTHEITLLWYKA